ncbi:unnamed protein product, partial [Effrenium voratum]
QGGDPAGQGLGERRPGHRQRCLGGTARRPAEHRAGRGARGSRGHREALEQLEQPAEQQGGGADPAAALGAQLWLGGGEQAGRLGLHALGGKPPEEAAHLPVLSARAGGSAPGRHAVLWGASGSAPPGLPRGGAADRRQLGGGRAPPEAPLQG